MHSGYACANWCSASSTIGLSNLHLVQQPPYLQLSLDRAPQLDGNGSDGQSHQWLSHTLLSCCWLCVQGVTKDSRKNRLAAKFVEAEFEKVDRLMEICFRCVHLVRAIQLQLMTPLSLWQRS